MPTDVSDQRVNVTSTKQVLVDYVEKPYYIFSQ